MASAFQNPSAPSPVASLGAGCLPPQPHEQLAPACFRLSIAIFDSDQLFVPVPGHPDHNQQTRSVIHAHVAVYPIDPSVDVTALAKVSLVPLLVLVTPTLLESADGVGREPIGLVTQHRTVRVLIIPGGDAFEVEPRQQRLYATGPLEIGLLVKWMPLPLRSRTLGSLMSTSPMPVWMVRSGR